MDSTTSELLKRVQPAPVRSRALSHAVMAGYPPKMAYRVAEVESFTGIPRKYLYAAHSAGELSFVLGIGNEKGNCIKVEEVDRWLGEQRN